MMHSERREKIEEEENSLTPNKQTKTKRMKKKKSVTIEHYRLVEQTEEVEIEEYRFDLLKQYFLVNVDLSMNYYRSLMLTMLEEVERVVSLFALVDE